MYKGLKGTVVVDKVNKRFKIYLIMFVVSASVIVVTVVAEPCDRECLKGFLTQYIEAMIADDIASLPLSSDVRFTEDCKEMQPGEGYWNEIDGTVAYRMDIIDVNRGGAFAYFVVEEGSGYVFFALRLKIAEQEITQVETMVVKDAKEGMLFNPDNILATDLSAMTEMPDESLLNSREEMQEMAIKYPLGLKNGGTFQSNGVPFVAEAFRLENGNLMAGPGCTFFSGCEDIRTQGLPTLPAMVYQVALVDEDAGIVLVRMNFGEGSVMGGSGVLDVFEAFKTYDDAMHVVFAFMQTLPDQSDRSPENLFKWDYDNDVTSIQQLNLTNTRKNAAEISVNRGLILSTVPENISSVTLRLFNLSGRCVFSRTRKKFNSIATFRIPQPLLSAGSYVASVQYADRKSHHTALVRTLIIMN